MINNVKMVISILLIIIFLGGTMLNGQEHIVAIDSLYLDAIEEFYSDLNKSMNSIWPDMKNSPVCLFRFKGPAILYNHPNPPAAFNRISDKLYIGKQEHLKLFGSTQMVVKDVLTAIVDYGSDYYLNKEEVFAELFHEMHHVYQSNYITQFDFDNPATLLKYPENIQNDAIKLYEQQTLFSMCFEKDIDKFSHLLNQFYSCRLEREKIIGDYINYEKDVENIEGPAFYCEYRFYGNSDRLSEYQKDNFYHKHFFSILNAPYYGRVGLRERHLAAGMAMCLILDRFDDNWKLEYYAHDIPLFDFFISRLNAKQINLEISESYFDICEHHTNQIKRQHQINYDNFMSQSGIKIILEFVNKPHFRGFDPMNAEAINDTIILHSTLLKLIDCENSKLYIHNQEALTVIDDIIWNTRKVIFFVAAEEITISNNLIQIVSDRIQVYWKGNLSSKNSNNIHFICN